jgi:hypothetical protein
MLRRFITNKKGTAEVIGSVLFIVILLFFFTNVYLWHDAATKEMNQLYVDKVSSPITVSIFDSNHLNVTNQGGIDTTLSMVWVNQGSSSGTGPDQSHTNFARSDFVPAGKSMLIPISAPLGHITYKVITKNGNMASCSYP